MALSLPATTIHQTAISSAITSTGGTTRISVLSVSLTISPKDSVA
jgi:hypothetical protein